jgi:hypothetical protein
MLSSRRVHTDGGVVTFFDTYRCLRNEYGSKSIGVPNEKCAALRKWCEEFSAEFGRNVLCVCLVLQKGQEFILAMSYRDLRSKLLMLSVKVEHLSNWQTIV